MKLREHHVPCTWTDLPLLRPAWELRASTWGRCPYDLELRARRGKDAEPDCRLCQGRGQKKMIRQSPSTA